MKSTSKWKAKTNIFIINKLFSNCMHCTVVPNTRQISNTALKWDIKYLNGNCKPNKHNCNISSKTKETFLIKNYCTIALQQKPIWMWWEMQFLMLKLITEFSIMGSYFWFFDVGNISSIFFLWVQTWYQYWKNKSTIAQINDTIKARKKTMRKINIAYKLYSLKRNRL